MRVDQVYRTDGLDATLKVTKSFDGIVGVGGNRQRNKFGRHATGRAGLFEFEELGNFFPLFRLHLFEDLFSVLLW